mmetsp:Transcript_24430/g.36587  ORF Transcript_24430/g.36587 Transcript_24430/m.36587 type:complete len:90 (-) Transcript_24430:1005-1274(-)
MSTLQPSIADLTKPKIVPKSNTYGSHLQHHIHAQLHLSNVEFQRAEIMTEFVPEHTPNHKILNFFCFRHATEKNPTRSDHIHPAGFESG